MSVETDDEATTFDPKPWGAMQRLLPGSRFAVVRTSGPLQAASVASIAPLPFALPVPVAQRPVTAFQPCVRPAPPAMTMPTGLPLPRPRPMPMPMPIAMTMPMPVAAFGAEVDSTLRVRRRPLTTRSMIAAPVGALVAAIVILIMTLGSSGRASAPAASVRMQTSQPPTVPVLAPVPAAPEAATEAVAETEAGDEEDFVILDEPQGDAPIAKSTKRSKQRVRKHRPRKIVAVDTSTPLGNLRPRRF